MGRKIIFYLVTIVLFVCTLASSITQAETNHISIEDSILFEKDFRHLEQLSKGNLDSLLKASELLYEKASFFDYDLGKIRALVNKSFAYRKMGQLDSAMYYAEAALKFSKSSKNFINDYESQQWSGTCHSLVGLCYHEMANYEQAIYHFIESEKIARKIKNNELLLKVLNLKSITYQLMQDYNTSLFHLNSILKEFSDTLSNLEMYRVTNNIANVYFDQKLYDQALDNFLSAKEYANATKDSIHIVLTDMNIANIYLKQNKLDDSKSLISEVIKYYTASSDRINIEKAFRIAGGIEYRSGNYAKAETYLRKATGLAKQQNNIQTLVALYGSRATNYKAWWIHEKIDDLLHNSFKCLEVESAYKDSLYLLESTKRLYELEKKYETEKKNSQITVLEKETEVQKSRQLAMIIGMALLVLIMGVLSVAFQYVRKTNAQLKTNNIQIQEQKEQIENQNQKLEAAIATQNKLFSIISHDLRSPLGSISNIAYLVKDASDDKRFEDVEKLINKLEQRNSQVLQLTDNLLSWASSQTGKLECSPSSYNLKNLLHEVTYLFEENLQQKQIELTVKQEENIEVFVDPLMIKTVFRNLLNNAIKFTEAKGQISIESCKEEKNAIVKITDSGVGIPENIKPIVFDVNEKKQKPGTEGEKSSGLGLVVCKEFIEKNNGEIWFESEEGQGTTFSVKLPLA